MDALRTPAPVASDFAADDEQGLVLQDDPAFAAVSDPELERWIGIVRRQANVACAALSLSDGSRQIIRVAGPAAGFTRAGERNRREHVAAGLPARNNELWLAVTRRSIRRSTDRAGRKNHGPPGARRSESADLVCRGARRAGGHGGGVATELERRLAKAQVARVHDLVASHNRVHDMIGTGAATP